MLLFCVISKANWCYVSLLACLFAATQQDNYPLLSNSVVDAIALTDINPEFADASPDGTMVAEVAVSNAPDATCDSRPRSVVAQPIQPPEESFALDYFISRLDIVSKWRQNANIRDKKMVILDLF